MAKTAHELFFMRPRNACLFYPNVQVRALHPFNCPCNIRNSQLYYLCSQVLRHAWKQSPGTRKVSNLIEECMIFIVCNTGQRNRSSMILQGYKLTVIPPFHIHSRYFHTNEPEVIIRTEGKFRQDRQFSHQLVENSIIKSTKHAKERE